MYLTLAQIRGLIDILFVPLYPEPAQDPTGAA